MGTGARAAGASLLLGIAYYAGAAGGIAFTSLQAGIAIPWIPNGLLLAALLLCPTRWWPGLLAAALAAGLAADVPRFTLDQAMGFAAVNLCECSGAAWALRRLAAPARFRLDSIRSVLHLILLGPVVAAGLAALVDAWVSRSADGAVESYLVLWAVWWLGDATGILLATPLVLVWTQDRALVAAALRRSPRRPEMAAVIALILACGWLVFANPWPAPLVPLAGYLMLPGVLWAALRFDLPGATLAAVLGAIFLVAATVSGTGPFGSLSPVAAITLAQENVTVLCLTGLMVAAALREADNQQRQLHLYRRALEAAGEGITIADASAADLPLIYANEAFLRITGYPRDEILGRNCRFLQGGERRQPGVSALRSAIVAGRPGRALLRNYRRDGTPFWNEVTLAPVHGRRGGITHVVGVQHDVTEVVQARESLEVAKAELEARVTERTRELEEANARLVALAGTDPLTGAMNRRRLDERAAIEIARAARTDRPLAVLLLDIDHFKGINDRFGHAAGDHALVTLTQVMRATLRDMDAVARLGGEEFLVLLPETGAHDARLAAERLRAAVADEVIHHGGDAFSVTASVGVTRWYPGEADLARAIVRADRALYRAKVAGRNRVAEEAAESASGG